MHMSETAPASAPRPEVEVRGASACVCPIVTLQKVSLVRDGQEVLKDIDLTVDKGEILGVVGPNGGGKTSLLRLILGLERPTRGEVELFCQPVARFREWRRVSYIPQHAIAFDQSFPATVREVVLLGRVAPRGPFRWLRKEDQEAANWAIEVCGLAGFEKRRVGELSGGEKQRVFIAKAVAARPELLVMDEPTTGVDAESERRFYDLLAELKEEIGLTVVLVSHDIGVVNARVDRVACLNRTLVYEGAARSLSDEDLVKRLYGSGRVSISHSHDRPHAHGH
jgi:zinc transport system ATP-binding protein